MPKSSESNSGSDGNSTNPTAAFAKLKSTIDQSKHSPRDTKQTGRRISLAAKLLIFGGVPSLTGLAGLAVSCLKKGRQGINFHQDFVAPFRLMLLLVIVVGFKSNGFATNELTWVKEGAAAAAHKGRRKDTARAKKEQ